MKVKIKLNIANENLTVKNSHLEDKIKMIENEMHQLSFSRDQILNELKIEKKNSEVLINNKEKSEILSKQRINQFQA